MKIRRLAKNSKALSPVIATIILVAVTVAIAIAVAAWLGALTFTYTGVEQLNITGATFTSTTAILSVSNTGTVDVTLATATVTGGSLNKAALTQQSVTSGCTLTGGQATVQKGQSCSITLSGQTFVTGTQYQFTLASTQGHTFLYNGIA